MLRSCSKVRVGFFPSLRCSFSIWLNSLRMSSSSLSSSSSRLITCQRIQYAHLRDSTSLRSIPSVERILSSAAFVPLIAEFGRTRVKVALIGHLERLRQAGESFDDVTAVTSVRAALATATASTLRRVINGSGVIIHTNLGRCLIDGDLWQRAGAIAEGYSNLEFDLEKGERGARDEHLETICRTLFGCEAA